MGEPLSCRNRYNGRINSTISIQEIEMSITQIARNLSMVAMVGTVALSGNALAQGRGWGGGRGHGMGMRGGDNGMVERALSKLDLTDAQKTQIKTLTTKFQSDNKSLIENVRSLGEKAHEYREAGDTVNARATRDQMKAQMQQLQTARKNLMTQIEALLTPEQKAKLEQMKAQRREHAD